MKIFLYKEIKTTNKNSKGILYEYINGETKLVNKNYELNYKSSKEIKVNVICQLISEGSSLISILEGSSFWAPSEYEFYLWLDNNPNFKHLYHKARKLRTNGIIERLFKHIEKSKSDFSEEKIEQYIKILKQVSDAMSKEDNMDDNKDIVNITLWDVYEDSKCKTP